MHTDPTITKMTTLLALIANKLALVSKGFGAISAQEAQYLEDRIYSLLQTDNSVS